MVGASHLKLPWNECHWLHKWSVNIGSGNGLVLSGNKPLSAPMLIQVSDDPHMVSLGQNELMYNLWMIQLLWHRALMRRVQRENWIIHEESHCGLLMPYEIIDLGHHWFRLYHMMWCAKTWSTLVQVVAWCLMAPSLYLSQCWLMLIYKSTRNTTNEIAMNL